jgi:predicted nucleotidyltransferase
MPAVRIPEEGLQARSTWLRRVEEGEYPVTTLEGRDAAQVRAIDESSEGSSLPPLGKWRTSIDVRGEGSAQLLSSSVEESVTTYVDTSLRTALRDLVASIRRAVPELKEKLPIRRVVVLFGSFAKGRAAAYGAVDLIVVCDGPSRRDAPATVGKTEEYIDGFEDESKDGDFLDTMGWPGPDRRRLTREVSVPRRLRFLVRPIGGTYSRYLFPIESCD